MRVGVVFIHYHTARLLASAVESVQRSVAGTGLAADIIIVDNGSDAAERALISALPARYVSAERNLGYACGANFGFSKTDAEMLILANPDVEVFSQCLPALVDALRHGAAAVGPRLYWDRDRQFLLPPTEERTRTNEVLKRLANRSAPWARRARKRWRRHARRHWLAARHLPTQALSGALLAIRRDALERVGPFDEGYKLYFEENDWLLRLKRTGLASYLVPEAEAIHLYNQSAAYEPETRRWFDESRVRFERRYYGAWFSHVLQRLASAPPSPSWHTVLPDGPPRLTLNSTMYSDTAPLWLEISPSPLGFPAGAKRLAQPLATEWCFPDEIWETLSPGTYYLTLSSAEGRELAHFCFDR